MSYDIPPSDLELALELRLANEKLSIFSFFLLRHASLLFSTERL